MNTAATTPAGRKGAKAKVDAAHPGWKALVVTNEFEAWLRKQTRCVRSLVESKNSSDAILLLDLFKRGNGRI